MKKITVWLKRKNLCWIVSSRINVNLFSADFSSKGYHVYRKTFWKNISFYQLLKVMKEVNETLNDIDLYYCKIMMKNVDRIRDVTVGKIFRELSRFGFSFIHEGGSVTGTVARITTIRSEGLEILILTHFIYESKLLLEKMSNSIRKQLEKIILFKFEEKEETAIW